MDPMSRAHAFMEMMEKNRQVEGYWNNASGDFPSYPMPLHKDEPLPGKEEILSRLEKAEERAEKMGFMGFSVCRCCGENLGSREFILGRVDKHYWVWPGGFRHYIEVHNIAPSEAFSREVLGLG